jgi:prepilin signal peptidase PulO-like enzyme (type II secretory pathway)
MNILLTGISVYEVQVNTAGRWLLIGLLALVGGVFGSFLNVVAYRLPRRMNLSRPGSHCPACQRPIRWHDNVPVLGWLKLRGRCRDCGAAISRRYPLVEALLAAISGVLAWKTIEILVGDLPGVGTMYGFDAAQFAFYLLLSCTLVAAALIEFDGFVPPRRLIWVPFVLGVAMSVPWRHLLPWSELFKTGGAIGAIAGMTTALAIGVGPWFTWFMSVRQSRFAYANAALAEFILVGGFLGDHAAVAIGLASMGLYLFTQIMARKWPVAGRFGWAGSLTTITLVWVLTWPDVPLDPVLSTSSVVRLIIGGVIMSVLAIVLQLLPPPERSVAQP